jgi:uncharacterized membrane protein YgcG|tara:strand:- start:318 stop:686 length:369 start_codon:yes stop_codon:yes gene_type:complete
MKRYDKTPIKKSKEGFRVYSTTYYPSIPLSDSDIFITTKESSRLDSLANQYYGDYSLWWVLAKANGIRGKTALKAGQILRIPGQLPEILDNFEAINESGDGTSSPSSGGSSGGGASGGGGGY